MTLYYFRGRHPTLCGVTTTSASSFRILNLLTPMYISVPSGDLLGDPPYAIMSHMVPGSVWASKDTFDHHSPQIFKINKADPLVEVSRLDWDTNTWGPSGFVVNRGADRGMGKYDFCKATIRLWSPEDFPGGPDTKNPNAGFYFLPPAIPEPALDVLNPPDGPPQTLYTFLFEED